MRRQAGHDRLAVWCGWVLVGAAVLAPFLAWVGPLAYAPLLGLVGLLCLPALRVRKPDRPVAAVLAAGLAWALLSTLWSPHRPSDLESHTGLKLVLQLAAYGSALSAVHRAPEDLRRLALGVLAWGLAAVGVLMLIEAATGGAVYQALRTAIGDPIRPDLARKNLAHGSFALAVLWPVAAAAGWRAGAPAWLAAPMAAGVVALAWLFLSDAPVIATPLSALAIAAALAWPRAAPTVLGAAAAAFVLLAPAAMLAASGLGIDFGDHSSWAQRMDYWARAAASIAEHPIRGWGLDASRPLNPQNLHPHNGALQLWLELGLPGALLGAALWFLVLRRLAGPERRWPAAGALGSAAAYLLFWAVSFGVWQEWWLALAVLVAMVAGLGGGTLGRDRAEPST